MCLQSDSIEFDNDSMRTCISSICLCSSKCTTITQKLSGDMQELRYIT